MQERLGVRFRYGVVLYLGPDAIRFGTHLAALPLSSLWTSVPPGTHFARAVAVSTASF